MQQYLDAIDKTYPLTTPQIAKALHVTGARIRQIAPSLQKDFSVCLKVGLSWKFTESAVDIIKQHYLR